MAKGDYILFDQIPFQHVTSHPRRYDVMFNPSSSRSRLRIIDAGRRYGVRLRQDGVVEYSIDGDVTWQTITPLKDPCTGKSFPKFFSHNNLRIGEALPSVVFDMIAVGRGRIIAKEAGTDRLFYLYMDEILRTHQLIGDGCKAENIALLGEDPPVPPFNMKIDPESFVEGPPSLVVPAEARRDYANHPGSLRLPIFNQLLELDIADMTLVMDRARTWYLKDIRSQLSIVGPEDLNFSEDDLKAVFTEPVIRDILESLKKALEAFLANLADIIVSFGEANLIAVLAQSVFAVIPEPIIKAILEAFKKALETSVDDLVDIIVRDFLKINDDLAPDWHKQLQEKGYGALAFPAYVAVGIGLWNARNAARPKAGGLIEIDLPGLMESFASLIDDPEIDGFINDAFAKLKEGISELMLRSRRGALQSYGDRPDVQRVELPPAWTLENRMPTPNQPPAWMPTYVRTNYVRRKGIWRGVWKKFYGDTDQLNEVWLGTNADGRLEAFGIAPDDTVWRTWQELPNGSWNGAWSPFHGETDKLLKLAITRNSDGRLEVFGVSRDNRIWRTWQVTPNNGWNNAWEELYSSADRLATIAAAQNQDGRLEVFGVAPDDSVWHTWQTTSGGAWVGKWEELYSSDDKLRNLWVASNADGRLEAFGVSRDDRIWHTWQTTPGSNWNGGWFELYSSADLLTHLAIGRNHDGRLEVFGLAPDRSIWRTSQVTPGGDWNGAWTELYTAEDKLDDLWVVTNADGRLELFGVSLADQDDRVWHTWQVSTNGDWNGAWIEIEAKFGRRTLAVATNADGQIELVGISSNTSSPNSIWETRLLSEKRYAIEFSKVLDIGIGCSHWSESWQKHFGGEIHSLLAPRPLFQQELYSLMQYRFLNGPVIDGDAFNDGTTNFYALVKLGRAGSDGVGLLQRYAILWFDEQTYFTQRWRLVHPTDDVLGDLFSLPHQLRNNPEWFNFTLAKFWSPFRDDLIDDNSRMTLSRYVIAVTGRNAAAQRYEIYTIVFNYGLCDHSWRWRLFPAATQVLIDSSIAQDKDPQLPNQVINGPDSAYVIVNTLNLRDDTMMHVRGSLRTGANPNLRVGRWLQRYLPADCGHVPERHELTGAKPAAGFDHSWDFVSEAAYKRADNFYQFGVYEHRLDSRGQYYRIDLLPSPNGVMPRIEDVVGHVWSNDEQGAGEERLKMNTINFNWSLPKANGVIVKRVTPEPNKPLAPELFVHEFRKRPSISMYEPTTRFRILERKPLGLIAVFYDKRDDELQGASDLPHPTTFRKDFADADIPSDWKTEEGEIPGPPPDRTPVSLRVMVKSSRRVWQPPNVRKALIVIDKAPGLRALHISFWTPQTEQEVCENIWRVSLAALDQTGVVPLISVTRFPNFVRRAFPDAPLPLGFRGELGDAWRYDFTWLFVKEVEVNVRRFCTPEGHIEFATSLWFEDIVGHRSLAQELIFA